MSQSNSNQPDNTVLKFWRVAFKLSFDHYNFSKFDQISLPNSAPLFEQDVFNHSTFYDLCHIKGKYSRYHPDFSQAYYLDLFSKTDYPCSVFIFVEEVAMQQGQFIEPPHQLTISHRAAKKLAAATGHNTATALTSKIDETPSDYEMFYVETSSLQLNNQNLSGQCLALTSHFIRGSRMQTGKALLKPLAFACYADARGMTLFKFVSYRGLVPNLKSSNTLLPMALIIGLNLGLKQSAVRINRALSIYLSNRLKAETGLNWRPGKYSKIFTNLYRKIHCFAACSYLSNQIDFRNPVCGDLNSELSRIFGLPQDYAKIQEHLNVISQMIQQMETKLILKSQRHIRMAIFLLGLSIVVCSAVVSTLLGIEPMIRLLVDLGALPPDMLKILQPITPM